MNRREFVVAAAALAVAPDAFARSLGGGRTVALVTADLESRIVALDALSGRRLQAIDTMAGPRSIQQVGAKAVVAHTEKGAISIVEGPTLELRRRVLELEEPRYTAASRDGRYAFVTDSASQALVVIDVIRGRVVRRLAVGGPARHVSITRDGRRLWVALGTKAERIAVIDVRDPRHPKLLGRIRPPFLAHDVGFASSSDRVWVTSGDRGSVAIFDPRTARVVTTVKADAPPQHVTFHGRVAFVTSGDSGTLRTHDGRTGRLLRTARVPQGSYNVQEGFGLVLTPSLSRGTLCVADARGRLLKRFAVARSSHDACFVAAA
jgi:DNA-binding beta-propeller fold protein YncE